MKQVTAEWHGHAARLRAAFPGRWTLHAFGPDGIALSQYGVTIIVTRADHDGFGEWLHASIARHERLPSYMDLTRLHRAVWPEGFAYQVFASLGRHVSIHKHALHLWGRADGANVLPDFGKFGTI
jgi:hypothetical protein